MEELALGKVVIDHFGHQYLLNLLSMKIADDQSSKTHL